MTVHYTPAASGGWLALCSGQRILVLGGAADAASRDALLEALADAAGFQTALDLLTASGLAATPPFALLDLDGTSLRAILRGEVSATVTDASGQQQLSGAGVATWAERSIPAISSVEVTVTGAVPVEGAGSLPLREGAAWIATISSLPGSAEPSAPV
ncbi:MAG: hypothetical protein JWO10_2199, partial [Microbacteriaceae bacterium]|nr:hypothetical protein [Microbacteriaceae bacterium]